MSPLNSYVKMSPYETGDICIEPERIATSGCDFILREGGSGTRQPRTAQPPPPAAARAGPYPAFGPHHLCRLQRPSPLRKTLRDRRLLARPRDPPPSVALVWGRLTP